MANRPTVPGLIFCGLVLTIVWNRPYTSPTLSDATSNRTERSQERLAQDGRIESAAESRRQMAVAALCASVNTNADYCQQWLDATDFVSLAKTARGVMLLSELLLAESEDANWQEHVTSLQTATTSLLQAAATEDKDASSQAIKNIKTSADQLGKAKCELAIQPSYKPGNDIGRTMDLLDATYADAKRALLFDEVASAQREAFVLWTLGEYLKSQNARGTSATKWHGLADAFSQAALTAAQLTDADSKKVSSALSLAREQCEKCHNRE